ncbi:MAG: acyl-[acyl-carrier-protein] thioesterase [Rubricoccaceae bacterium]
MTLPFAAPAPALPAPDDPWLWREPFRVRAYEIGPDERATVLTLCDYFQEAAGEHARAAGVETFALPSGGVGVWVLRRLGLRLVRRPAWREHVRVETWPSHYEGLLAHRDFVVRAAAGAPDGRDAPGDVLAFGTSAWFVIDAARRRPVRLPEGVGAFGPPTGAPRALVLSAEPEPPSDDADARERRFHVRRSDLDRNAHANNVRFAEWALEAVPDAVQAAHTLASLDVSFRAEAVSGDTVLSRAARLPAAPAGDLAYTHALLRERDGRMLALARSTWHSS